MYGRYRIASCISSESLSLRPFYVLYVPAEPRQNPCRLAAALCCQLACCSSCTPCSATPRAHWLPLPRHCHATATATPCGWRRWLPRCSSSSVPLRRWLAAAAAAVAAFTRPAYAPRQPTQSSSRLLRASSTWPPCPRRTTATLAQPGRTRAVKQAASTRARAYARTPPTTPRSMGPSSAVLTGWCWRRRARASAQPSRYSRSPSPSPLPPSPLPPPPPPPRNTGPAV
jgi:hypothetical protein